MTNPSTPIAAALRARTEALLRADTDPAAIHDRRVASRRLRVAWELFAERAGLRARCPKALRALTRALGPGREWDVHLEHLAALRKEAPGPLEQAALEQVALWAGARRAKARRRCAEALRDLHLRPAARDLERLAQALEDSREEAFAASVLEARTQAAWAPLQTLAEAEDAQALHEARIRLKQLRYALEWLALAAPDGHAEALARARALQDALGLHHDLGLLEALLRRRRATLERDGARALAQGLAWALQRVAEHRKAQFRAFRDLVDAEAREPLLGRAPGGVRPSGAERPAVPDSGGRDLLEEHVDHRIPHGPVARVDVEP